MLRRQIKKRLRSNPSFFLIVPVNLCWSCDKSCDQPVCDCIVDNDDASIGYAMYLRTVFMTSIPVEFFYDIAITDDIVDELLA